MFYHKFLNKRYTLRDFLRQKKWFNKYSSTPYCMLDKRAKKKLKFVRAYLFGVYCDATPKLNKMYWRMHKGALRINNE